MSEIGVCENCGSKYVESRRHFIDYVIDEYHVDGSYLEQRHKRVQVAELPRCSSCHTPRPDLICKDGHIVPKGEE